MPDVPDRRERLLNLLAAMLESMPGLTRDELMENPSLGYPPGAEAARRAFERDKASLRAMGVPLQERTHNNVTRYRVDPKEYYLPDLRLTDDELAALHVAVTGVGVGSGAGEGALMKLGGLEGTGAVPIAELPLGESLAPLFEASRRRQIVRFRYRGKARELEPWGLTSKFGHWYIVGLDHDTNEMRVFRTDRIEGAIEADAPKAFSVPGDFRADAYLEDQPWEYGPGPPIPVRVRVDGGHEAGLLARVPPRAKVETSADGCVVVELAVVNVDALRSFVLGFLEHAEVLSPPEVRAAMVEWLEALAGVDA